MKNSLTQQKDVFSAKKSGRVRKPGRCGAASEPRSGGSGRPGRGGLRFVFPKGTIIRVGPGLERGGLFPLYIMANFYTDHPEIPAAEEKYFVRKIRARPSASRNETWCK